MQTLISKWLFGIVGGLLALFEQTVPFILICLFAMIVDCYTAFHLSRRLSRKYPEKYDGKFRSVFAKRKWHDLKQLSGVIVLLWMLDTYVFTMFDGLYLPHLGAGVYCFIELSSILENISTESDATWAKALQRVLASKAERHIDPAFSQLINDKKNNGTPH
ncbi:MAG: phage holin family protein [Marinilabiliaceae bacterium]|nr:phage holin family protein [Marinilabiliaceae bacterium]